MTDQVVIVGAGHGAGQVVATLRQQKYAGRIVLIGEESWLPYQRPPLSKKFLAGDMPAERLFVKPPSFYEYPAIDLRLGTRVDAIDREARSVRTADGETIRYTNLVLATGSRVRRLDLPGSDLGGIHYLRGIDDVNAIRDDLAPAERIVIVGAGYIGLEVAAVAAELGKAVTVVEMADRVMSRVVSPELSSFYADVHRAAGVELRLGTGVAGFAGAGGRANGVSISGGETLPADLVVVGVGIVPNVELAADAGLEIDDGIVVDEHCRTADPHVFAIGDCTAHPSRVYGRRIRLESVPNALEQARVAVLNILGGDDVYDQVPWFWSDQYDLKLQIVGLSTGYDRAVMRGDPATRSFSCAYFRGDRLIAVDAVNNPKDFMQAKALIAKGATPDPDRLGDATIPLKEFG
ncbi:MAG: FAD-dependent oxidoreductase [Woeseiaceae bacterium]|jgi:3-phenylpropionate/trans-cinnamate dioxygenase ferredoxin reductase subunit|nr:FAD-dependent oxidoreductase [Woeseiaceae bacterium]